MNFFGLCVGTAVTGGDVLTTVTITSPLTYAAYVGVLGFSVALSDYFGLRGLVEQRAAKRKVKELKGESLGK